MLQNIKPQPKNKKSKDGSLNEEEKSLAKGLLALGYRAQDVTFIINQGRVSTVNQARVSEVVNNFGVKAAKPEAVNHYLKVQSSYDSKTLLNPYKDHRLIRARDAMIAAVQIFNSPTVTFRTENFCVLANIAWTYLLHEKMEQTESGSSKLFNGNSITVGGTLEKDVSPIKDLAVIENLKMLVKIRDDVEHNFFEDNDECFGALFQACCINFENHLTEWFGEHLSLTKELSLALQFVKLKKQQIVQLEGTNFAKKITTIYEEIRNNKFVNDNAFQLNVYYTTEVTAKTKSNIQHLVNYEEGKNYSEIAIKKVNYKRCGQGEIVKIVQDKGYKKFTTHQHQKFWQQKWPNSKTRNKEAGEYGEVVMKNIWLWYKETWLPLVLKYCEDNKNAFK